MGPGCRLFFARAGACLTTRLQIREEWACRRKRGTHRGADPLSIATEADMINARVQNDDTDRQLMNVWCCSMCEQWNRVPYYYSICQHLQRE